MTFFYINNFKNWNEWVILTRGLTVGQELQLLVSRDTEAHKTNHHIPICFIRLQVYIRRGSWSPSPHHIQRLLNDAVEHHQSNWTWGNNKLTVIGGNESLFNVHLIYRGTCMSYKQTRILNSFDGISRRLVHWWRRQAVLTYFLEKIDG